MNSDEFRKQVISLIMESREEMTKSNIVDNVIDNRMIDELTGILEAQNKATVT